MKPVRLPNQARRRKRLLQQRPELLRLRSTPAVISNGEVRAFAVVVACGVAPGWGVELASYEAARAREPANQNPHSSTKQRDRTQFRDRQVRHGRLMSG